MTQIGFILNEEDQPKVQQIVDFAEDNLDNEQLLAKLMSNPEIKSAAEEMKKLLAAAGEAQEDDKKLPDELGLDEGVGDIWLKFQTKVSQGAESIGSALQKLTGENPNMVVLGTTALAMTLAASDPQAAQTIMKMGGSILKGDGKSFLQHVADVAPDVVGESKKTLESQISQAVMEILAEADPEVEDWIMQKAAKKKAELGGEEVKLSPEDKEMAKAKLQGGEDQEKHSKTIEYLLKTVKEDGAEAVVKGLTASEKDSAAVNAALDAFGGAEEIMKSLKPEDQELFKQFVDAAKGASTEEKQDIKALIRKHDIVNKYQTSEFIIQISNEERVAFFAFLALLHDTKMLSEVGAFKQTVVSAGLDWKQFETVLTKLGKHNEAYQTSVISALNDETKASLFIKMLAKETGEEPPAEEEEELDLKDIQAKYEQTDLYKNSKTDNEKKAILYFFYYYNNPQQLQELTDEPKSDMRSLEDQERKRVSVALATLKKKSQDYFEIIRGMLHSRDKEFYQAMLVGSEEAPEQEKTEPEEGAFKKEEGVHTEGLVEALDEFMGQPAGNEPNFYYPESNLLKEQGQILLKLFSKIRILLDLETPDMHRELLAFNDRNLGKVQKQQKPKEPSQAAPEQSPAAPAEPAGKRDTIYEAKEITASDATPQDLTILRDYIKDAITTVQIYLDVAKEGQRGSKELYSKYGSVIGTDAYDPKKVLYQINLKNIVNLCNTFLTRLESSMVQSGDEEKDQLQEATKVPFAQIVKEVKAAFDFVIDQGSQLKKMVQDHAVETKGAEQPSAKRDVVYEVEENPEMDPAKRAAKANPENTGEDVTKVEPAVASIRKTGEGILEQLNGIKQHFPLVNPFESDLYGDKGFKESIRILKGSLKDLVSISGQLTGIEDFGKVSAPAQKALFEVLERIVKNIKDTFAGEYDERPAVNNETDPKDFEDKAPEIGGDTEEETDEPTESGDLSQYLAQEEEFYKGIVRIRNQYAKGALKDMSLEEAAIKDPIKYLGDLRIKIEEYQAKLDKDDELKADKFAFRQAMKIYKEYLERYIVVYEQFKDGNLELSFAQSPEEKAGLREAQLKQLQEVMEQYKNFHAAVNQFNLTVQDGKPNAETTARILDVLETAADKAGILGVPSAVVTSAEKENKSAMATQERNIERGLKSKKGISDLFLSGGLSYLKSLINPVNIFVAGGAIAAGAAAAGFLGEDEKAPTPPPEDPDIDDSLLDTDDKEFEDYEALSGIGQEFAKKLQLFDSNYKLGEYFVKNIVSYSKQLKDNLGEIAKHAKKIRQNARDLAGFLSKNADQIRNSLIKIAKIKLPTISAEKPKGLPGETAIEVKYKSVLDKYEGKEKSALLALLNKLQELGEEMLQEHKWLLEMIEKELDFLEEADAFPPKPTKGAFGDPQDIGQRSAATGKTSDKKRQTTMRTKSGEEFEELPMTDVGAGGKPAKPRAQTLEQLVDAILGKGNFDKLSQGKGALKDDQIKLLGGMFNRDSELAYDILAYSEKVAHGMVGTDSTISKSEERYEAAKALAKSSEILSVGSLIKSFDWSKDYASDALMRLKDEGILGPYDESRGGFPVIKKEPTDDPKPEEESSPEAEKVKKEIEDEPKVVLFPEEPESKKIIDDEVSKLAPDASPEKQAQITKQVQQKLTRYGFPRPTPDEMDALVQFWHKSLPNVTKQEIRTAQENDGNLVDLLQKQANAFQKEFAGEINNVASAWMNLDEPEDREYVAKAWIKLAPNGQSEKPEEKTDTDQAPEPSYDIPEDQKEAMKNRYLKAPGQEKNVDGFFKPNLPKFIRFLGDLKFGLEEAKKKKKDHRSPERAIIPTMAKQLKFDKNKALEKYRTHPDKEILKVFLQMYSGGAWKQLKPVWDSIEKKESQDDEFIQGEEPSAADLAAAGPNKPVRVASPRRKVAAEALVDKLRPIIRELIRGTNG